MIVNSLRQYIEGLGGRLELVARFDSGPVQVRLKYFDYVSKAWAPQRGRPARRRYRKSGTPLRASPDVNSVVRSVLDAVAKTTATKAGPDDGK